MEHLLRQIAEATRVIELATAQIEQLKGIKHDLEIENQRLRDNLAFRATQYEELQAAYDNLTTISESLSSRLRTARTTIRRMENGEL